MHTIRFTFFLWLLLSATHICFAQNSIQQNGSDTATVAKRSWDDDSYWKWGILYFNKEDKRVFPPKRDGLGWTVNFANPLSVGAIVLIIVLIFAGNNYSKKRVSSKKGV